MGTDSAYEESSSRITEKALRNPGTPEEIVAALNHDVRGSEWILAPLFRQNYEDILWMLGEQYQEWNESARRFQVRPARQYISRNRSITNHILPKVEIGIDMFMESLPRPKYVPQTKEDRDRAAAEVANGIIRTRDEETNMEAKKHDIAAWTVSVGEAYLQTIEDLGNKEIIENPVMNRTIEPVTDDAGQPILGPGGVVVTRQVEVPVMDPETKEPQVEQFILSDEGTEVISPMEIVPDWGARYPWEMRRYTHFRARPRDWIGRIFGAKVRDKVKAERHYGILGDYQLRMLDIISRSNVGGRLGFSAGRSAGAGSWRFMEDAAMVISRWELPSVDHPNGRLLIVAGDVVLEDGDYPHGNDLNLHMFRWSVLPGSIKGFGMVRNLKPMQRRLNGLDTQDDLIRKTMGNPGWLVPLRSQFSVSLGTAEPGHVYSFKVVGGGVKPERLDPKGPHPFNVQQRQAILQDIDRVSGVNDVLYGNNPTGVTAGVSLELLTEQAGRRFQPAIKSNRETWRRAYLARIKIAQDSNAWKIGRSVALIGEDGERDIQHFTAADFTGSISVDVEAVPLTAFSQALKRQNFEMGIKIGLVDIVNSAANRERGRGLYGLSEFDEAFSLDYKRAQMENEMLVMGQSVHIGPADDHEVHAEVVGRLIKSRKWDDYPSAVKSAILRHFDAHMLRLIPSVPEQVGPDGKPVRQPISSPSVGGPPAQPGAPPIGPGGPA